GQLLVLDEPFVGVDRGVRPLLLERVAAHGASSQMVLLTEDPDVLGWAIELPAEDAAAMPADALLARLRRTDHDVPAPTAPASRRIDITTDAPSSVSFVDDST